MTTNSALATQVADALTRWNAQLDQLADWLTGDPFGGPNGDGTYPLTNALRETENFLCLPAVIDKVSGPAAQADLAKAASQAAASLSETYRDKSEDAQALSEAARDLAKSYRDQTETMRDDTDANRAAVQVWHDAVGQNAATVVAARDVTLTYRDETNVARDDTFIARDEAQVARDQAEGFAASINPAVLATKAELQSELDALVDAAPGTLDTLNEIAAALGDDPNFATTMTNSLANKSDIGHGHVIADVSGLQTALDGKAPVGNYALAGHAHAWTEITGKPTTFAPSAHGHVIADVSGLQTALDGKALVGHSHSWAQITGKPSTFAPSAHGHVIADVSGLQAALDGKAASSHTHDYLPLSGGSLPGSLTVTGELQAKQYGFFGSAMTSARIYIGSAASTGNSGVVFRYSGGLDKTLYCTPNGDLTWGGQVFSFTDHTHSYLPLSGGSLTGALVTQKVTFDEAVVAGGGARLRLVNTSTANYIQSALAETSGSAAPLIFSTMFSVAEWARFDVTGKFGLGTSAPAEKLHVSGGTVRVEKAAYDLLHLKRTNSENNVTICFEGTGAVKQYLGLADGVVKVGTQADLFGSGYELWHEGNFNPATKADASHTHNYVPRGHLSGYVTADANSVDNEGVSFKYLSGGANASPAGVDHALMTLSYSTTFSAQMAGDWRTNNWYVRTQQGGAWGSWRKLWHDGNFDPATKAAASHTHSEYLPKTGGTVTGTLGVGTIADLELKIQQLENRIATLEMGGSGPPAP